jgi:hypothetical protein
VGGTPIPGVASVSRERVQAPKLRRVRRHGMVADMSANEVLDQVKALPPRERRKFFERVRDLEAMLEAGRTAGPKRRIRWPDAAARRRRICGDRVLPNLVLAAREEERY